MITTVLAWFIMAIFLFLFLRIGFSITRATSSMRSKNPLTFFLPNDFFISLVLMLNFWLVLLLILGSLELPEEQQKVVVIIASIVAPFLSWWRKKRMEEL